MRIDDLNVISSQCDQSGLHQSKYNPIIVLRSNVAFVIFLFCVIQSVNS